MNQLSKKLLSFGVGAVLTVSATYVIIPQEGEVVNKNGEHVVYKDIVGIATTCWGQTGYDMEGVKISPGMVYSEDYCARWFSKELTDYNKNIRKYITVPIKPYEEVAYTSLAWNIGISGFANSTLVKKLNTGDHAGACKEILNWNKATFSYSGAQAQIKARELCTIKKDGKYSCTVKGLTNRRVEEYNTCLGKNKVVNDALKALEPVKNAPEMLKNVSQGVAIGETNLNVHKPSDTTVKTK